MNDKEIELLEKELADLKPRGLSSEKKNLLIDHIMAGGEQRKIIQFPAFLTAAAVAAAAVIAVLFVVHSNDTNRPLKEEAVAQAPVPVRKPSTPLPDAPGIDTILVSNEDNGIVYLDDHTPVRRIRYQVIDRAHWTDPVSGRRQEMLRPRSGIVLTGLRVD